METSCRTTLAANLQITGWCHHFVEMQVQPGDFVIDATAGRGNDTEFLCRLVGPDGHVLAFDIQEDAVRDTSLLLLQKGLLERADVILDSHENMGRYIKENSISCIMFNFGYLPGGDHSLATLPKTSIRAMETGLTLLKQGGLMSLCIYSGKDSGFEERDAILSWLKTLDSRKYLVILSSYYNRPNDPPIPVLIRKL